MSDFKVDDTSLSFNPSSESICTWEISLGNVYMSMANPIPNRFQRWMLKKFFGFKIKVYDKI